MYVIFLHIIIFQHSQLKAKSLFKILHIYILTLRFQIHIGPKFIITLPADGLTPNSARPSTGTVLTEKLDMFSFKFCWFPIILCHARHIIQSDPHNPIKYHGISSANCFGFLSTNNYNCNSFNMQNLSIWSLRSHLTHWGWVMHICISKLTIIGLDDGLLPGRCHAIF